MSRVRIYWKIICKLIDRKLHEGPTVSGKRKFIEIIRDDMECACTVVHIHKNIGVVVESVRENT